MNIETIETRSKIKSNPSSKTEIVNISSVCRLCATDGDKLIGIFGEDGLTNDLPTKINSYLPINIDVNDNLPMQVCLNCASTLLAWHELVVTTVEADRKFRNCQLITCKPVIEEEIFRVVGPDQTSSDGDRSSFRGPSPLETNEIEHTLEQESDEESEAPTKHKEMEVAIEAEVVSEPKLNPLLCQICQKQCKTRTAYESHRKKCERCSTCNICNKVLANTFSLRRHNEKCHDGPQVTRPKISADELPQAINGVYECDRCQQKCKTAVGLRRHKELKCDKGEIQCEACKETFSKHYNLRRHKAVCVAADKTFADIADIANRKCRICDLDAFESAALLKKHVKQVHNVVPVKLRRRAEEVDGKFVCDICGSGFTRKFDLERHQGTKHHRKKVNENLILLRKNKIFHPDGTVRFHCETCNRIFEKSYNFMRHRTIHTGVRSFICHICGKTFRTNSCLSRHLNEFHYNIRKFRCDICGKGFTSKATRDEHLNIHTEERPFGCEICGKKYKQRSTLQIHSLYHREEKDFPTVCGTCGKKFRRPGDLKVHMWLHTGYKPHVCPQCPAAFRLAQSLKRHLVTHEEKSPQCVCSDCGSKFTHAKYLKAHQKIHQINQETTS